MPSQRHADQAISATLEPVVAAAVAAAGFDLETIDVSPAGRRRVVKVVVDSDNGVALDSVAEISRVISTALDIHELSDAALGGPYTLEVTSPGLDRPLTKPRHWRRSKLRLVRVTLTDGAQLTGRVGTADDVGGGVELLVDRVPRHIPYADIERAVVEVEFRPPPADELAMLGSPEHDVEEESR